MRILIAASFCLALAACASVEVRPEKSVEIEASEAVLRGEAPCEIRVTADGEQVFELVSTGDVRCPLPASLLAPKGGDNE